MLIDFIVTTAQPGMKLLAGSTIDGVEDSDKGWTGR
jgi:hypothetical protein